MHGHTILLPPMDCCLVICAFAGVCCFGGVIVPLSLLFLLEATSILLNRGTSDLAFEPLFHHAEVYRLIGWHNRDKPLRCRSTSHQNVRSRGRRHFLSNILNNSLAGPNPFTGSHAFQVVSLFAVLSSIPQSLPLFLKIQYWPLPLNRP
jgi:hypothetical protein